MIVVLVITKDGKSFQPNTVGQVNVNGVGHNSYLRPGICAGRLHNVRSAPGPGILSHAMVWLV